MRVYERGQQAVSQCRRTLEREGFHVSELRGRGADPALLATSGAHRIGVIIVSDAAIDDPKTRSRLRASAARGETRVFVDWRLRWRMVSNLERWRIGGVSVATL
jgi:hypothetical protein